MNIEKRGNYTKVEDLIKPSVLNTNHAYQFDVKNAPDLLLKAMIDGQRITVIGDYDCDGIFASCISYLGFNRLKNLLSLYTAPGTRASMPETMRNHLVSFTQRVYNCDANQAHNILALSKATSSNVRIRIPLRYTEGYGMKESMVDEVNSGVLFTVDNGIAAAGAIQKANEKGLTTIVTDHHSLPVVKQTQTINGENVNINTYVIPPAHCVVNPHMEETMNEPGHYDFYDYCGAGIALKIVESLLHPSDKNLEPLYAFAAIATVADVMPMTEDNRNIYLRGVQAIRDGNITPGLSALLEVSKINVKNLPDKFPAHALITTDIMGYTLGPKVNAPGRVGTAHPASAEGDRGAERSIRCMLATDARQARDLALELHEANENRKNISKEMQMKCEEIIALNHMENDCPLVVHIPECRAGVIGLVAGYLCEKYKVPSIVLNGEGDKCKGSARSPEGANMKAMLDEVQQYLIAYGGHPGAAGLTISEKSIDKFRNSLYNICKEWGITSQRVDTVQYDLEIDASDVEHNLEVLTHTLAPFGEQNPEPVFLVRNLGIKDAMVLGGKHLKLIGDGVAAIGFHMAEGDTFVNHVEQNPKCDVIGTLSYNCFRGEATPQVSIQNFVIGDEILLEEPKEPELEEEVK